MRFNILRLWTRTTTSLTSGAVLIAAASFFSRILGLFRDRILAGEFGAGDALDVYYAAFRLPDMLYNFVIVGALSAGFIPIFVAMKQKKFSGGAHWRLANNYLTTTLLGLSVVSVAGFIATPWLTPLIAPGFSTEKLATVTTLTRIMFFSPIFLGVSAVFGGVLQSFRNFFIYALAPIFYNIGIILGALFFVPLWGIQGLAWGVVLGAFLHLLVQVPAVVALKWPIAPSVDLHDPELRTIWRLTVPRTLALGAQQLNTILVTMVASFLAAGSVAIFNLATNLAYVPVALFGISYALAAFPSLSEAASKGDHQQFRKTFGEAVNRILFFIVPVAVLYFILRAQIVRVVYGSSISFDWIDTVLTVETLSWLSLAFLAQGIAPLLLRGLYAYQRSVSPLIVTLLGDIMTLIISVLAVRSHGVAGIGMAVAAGAFFQTFLLWLLLRLESDGLNERATLVSGMKIVVAALIAGFVAQGMKTGAGVLLGTTTVVSVLVQGGVAAIVSLLTYASVLVLLRSEELVEFMEMIHDRLYSFTVEKEGLRDTL